MGVKPSGVRKRSNIPIDLGAANPYNNTTMPTPKSIKGSDKDARVFKLDSSERELFVLLDQTRDTIFEAVGVEIQHLRINVAQTRILFMLTREKEGATLSDISKWAIRKLNSVSTLVNRMEKNGLVKKTKKDTDNRSYITLTNKGRALFDQINERSIHLVLSALSKEEKQQLRLCLKKLRAEARNLLGLDFKPPFLP